MIGGCYTSIMTFTSLYIHIPFCLHRCGYCDFNTYAGLQGLISSYTKAVCKELEYIGHSSKERLLIHTVYFGGGTPSLVPPKQLFFIVNTIRENFCLSPSAEITLEANPGTLSLEYLKQIMEMGVSRLSLGMQSYHPHELAMLERQHSYSDVVRAVEWAGKAEITNFNLDLIFGLPDQDLKSWRVSLEAALALQPVHLSLYALTLEHGTPLHYKVATGCLPEPDADLAADMYETARERLSEAGFAHYEISNWARERENDQTYMCRHNLQYWRTLPYLGVGAGAHGFVNHYRTVNIKTPAGYIKRMKEVPDSVAPGDRFPLTPATVESHFINKDTEIGEMMMMGLRLTVEGVSDRAFEQRYGMSLQEIFGPQIERLVALGLLEWAAASDDRLRLTEKGQLLGNLVFREFI
jgi:oxygen-independent coproporphyrinogen-3 oxidase